MASGKFLVIHDLAISKPRLILPHGVSFSTQFLRQLHFLGKDDHRKYSSPCLVDWIMRILAHAYSPFSGTSFNSLCV